MDTKKLLIPLMFLVVFQSCQHHRHLQFFPNSVMLGNFAGGENGI